MTTIALKDLHPNPFRHLERYPIRRDKVEALKASISSTEFWDNLVARKADANGKYEIAYGHHRLTALKELGIRQIDIPVRQLEDEMMIRIMANENMEEWGASALIEQETVRTVVEAYARGQISLSVPDNRGTSRSAPSFKVLASRDARNDKPYNSKTISEFLGDNWPEWRVRTALTTLTMQEECGNKIDFTDLAPRQARSVVEQIGYVENATGSKETGLKIGAHLADEFRSMSGTGTPHGRGKEDKRLVSIHTAKDRAEELMFEYGVERTVNDKIHRERTKSLEKYDNQVKEFLDCLSATKKLVWEVRHGVSKFSPEARRFSIRRIDALASELEKLKGELQ